MKKLTRWFVDFFHPSEFNNLDTAHISESFNDPMVRRIWLQGCFEELRRMNFEVDKRLLSGSEMGLTDLCARRKAFQDVLEAILSARRQVTPGIRPNPKVEINLDRVTA